MPALNASSVPESKSVCPLPTLLIPETVSSGSSSLYTRNSLSVSPALSAVSLPSQLGKHQCLNQSGLFRSVSGSLPPLSPVVLGQSLYGFSDQPCTAVLASAERCWGQCDQEVFIAAVIVNPFYKILPFKKIPLTYMWGLRHFSDYLEDYMSGSHDFAHIDVYKFALLSRADKEGIAVDPINIWDGLSHPGSLLRPLHSIALRLLSICPNSASYERLFSVFGAILMKWRNRLSTETLTLLAELKMYVHEEHVHNDVLKKRLKRQYCDEKESVETQATNDSDAGSGGQEQRSIAFERQGIRQLAHNLIQAVGEEEAVVAEEMMHSAPTTDPFTCIPISDLLDYSHAKEWLGSFYKTAIRGLDAELKLYKLLDSDAEGIEDLEFPQVDDVLAE
ncbi:uncharacterized protein EDB93DRAFT_1245973 [Suillus bovinus]|uniref:uncharacterized protein n=1 Tax=Suillus bovinus TaxID=48563 RepID=UPI001B865704|nr:uncharacterized protein EDB93DRAFT_1245973 [Suillus bovinus]KAG2158740.1 hypothetical protein EDB93DRAFT_1245973 [Suillus bovinus]